MNQRTVGMGIHSLQVERTLMPEQVVEMSLVQKTSPNDVRHSHKVKKLIRRLVSFPGGAISTDPFSIPSKAHYKKTKTILSSQQPFFAIINRSRFVFPLSST